MTCIFESNLRNNPMHNRHILREYSEYGDGTGEKVVRISCDCVRSGEPDEYEEWHDDEGTKSFRTAEDVYRYLERNGFKSMDETGADWWATVDPTYDSDYIEDGVDKTYTAAPVSGFTDDEIDYINGRLDGDRDEEPEYSDGIDGEFDDEPAMESCVFGSNLLGHGGYGNSILREEADCIGIRCARPKNGYCADIEKVDCPEYEKPEVKKTPRLCPKRNRRLRSKTRNIQLWDTKKKRFAPEWGNTRFTRMKDANDAIAKLDGGK